MRSVLDLDPSKIAPYLLSYSPEPKTTDWAAIAAKGDPLRMSESIYLRLYWSARLGSEELKQDAKAGLDVLINKWPNGVRTETATRWNYDFPYRDIEAGWWSGMDGFITPLALLAAYETFGDEAYLTLAKEALHTSLRSPADGGSVWSDRSGCWISEYSWRGMSPSDEYYVLNGHLYGLQALRIVADALQDEDAQRVYDCAVLGTKNRASLFQRGDWSYYMLTPRVPVPPHYAIFETAQFASLYALTNDPFFDSMRQRRADNFAAHFPLSLSDDGRLVFSHLGPPDPYLIDTYAISISCTLTDGSIWEVAPHAALTEENPLDRFFIVARPPLKPTTCTTTSHVGGRNVELYAAVPMQPNAPSAAFMNYKMEVAYDANAERDSTVEIVPAMMTEAGPEHYTSTRASIMLKGDFPISDAELFALEVTPAREIGLGITIADRSGSNTMRYYPRLPAAKPSLILLSRLGFPDNDKLAADLSEITVQVWTDPASLPDQSPFEVRVGRLLKFASPLALYDYLSTSAFEVPEQR